MGDAAGDLLLVATKFRANEIDAATTRDSLALIRAMLDECDESLRRLSEQERGETR
jgi:hypothetical protein